MNTPFINRLRLLFALWVAAVLLLGFMVLRDTNLSGSPHGLLTFLFRADPPVVFSQALTPLISADPPLPPVAETAMVPPVVEKAPALPELPHGKKNGKGTLGPIRVEIITTEQVVITVPYTGTLGECTTFAPQNVVSQSVDLHGTWKLTTGRIDVPHSPLVRLIQSANHGQFARLSIIAGKGIKALQERIEYSPTEIIIHVTQKP